MAEFTKEELLDLFKKRDINSFDMITAVTLDTDYLRYTYYQVRLIEKSSGLYVIWKYIREENDFADVIRYNSVREEDWKKKNLYVSRDYNKIVDEIYSLIDKEKSEEDFSHMDIIIDDSFVSIK